MGERGARSGALGPAHTWPLPVAATASTWLEPGWLRTHGSRLHWALRGQGSLPFARVAPSAHGDRKEGGLDGGAAGGVALASADLHS